MELKDLVPIVISLLSALVSILALWCSYKTSQEMKWLTIKGHNSVHLKKYSDELSRVRGQVESIIGSISTEASLKYHDIINEIDSFDEDPSARPLRHIAHDIVDQWMLCFRYELGWQTYMNLYRRMDELLYVDDSSEVDKKSVNFQKEYKSWKNKYLDCELKRSRDFQALLKTYHSRLTNEEELYQRVREISDGVINSCLVLKEKFKDASDALEKLMGENSIEETKLEDSYPLYSQYKCYIAKMKILENFYLMTHKMRLDFNNFRKNQILLILFGLELLAEYDMWGSDCC